MLDQAGRLLTKAEFASVVGSAFIANTSDGAELELRLIALNDSSSDVQETYTLEFLAPLEMPSVQGTYRLVNEEVGDFELFLVPYKKDVSGLYFEVVFNRFIELVK